MNYLALWLKIKAIADILKYLKVMNYLALWLKIKAIADILNI
jgi:hypothetical protein